MIIYIWYIIPDHITLHVYVRLLHFDVLKCEGLTGFWPIAGFMVSQHGGSAFARWYPQTLSGPEHHWLTNTINTVTCYLYNGYIRGTKYVETFFKRSSHVNIDSHRHQPIQGISILCFLVSFVLTPSVHGWRCLSSISFACLPLNRSPHCVHVLLVVLARLFGSLVVRTRKLNIEFLATSQQQFLHPLYF